MIRTDSLFRIGRNHDVCQDYSIDGKILVNNFGYIIVSDGCSASTDTDFGSRLLTRFAENLLVDKLDQFDPRDAIFNAYQSLHHLSFLTSESLDATLLTAQVIDNKYMIYVCGDGVVTKTRKDGTVEVTSVEFPSGAPRYLNYEINKQRLIDYNEMFGTKRIVSQINIAPDGKDSDCVVSEEQYDGPVCITGSTDNYNCIALFTDGILSFRKEIINESGTSKSNEVVPLTDVVKELVSFKNYGGRFFHRRVQKFTKDCERWRWHHYDDLGCGAIYFGDE